MGHAYVRSCRQADRHTSQEEYLPYQIHLFLTERQLLVVRYVYNRSPILFHFSFFPSSSFVCSKLEIEICPYWLYYWALGVYIPTVGWSELASSPILSSSTLSVGMCFNPLSGSSLFDFIFLFSGPFLRCKEQNSSIQTFDWYK